MMLPRGRAESGMFGGRRGERISASRGSSRGRIAPSVRVGGRCVGMSGEWLWHQHSPLRARVAEAVAGEKGKRGDNGRAGS